MTTMSPDEAERLLQLVQGDGAAERALRARYSGRHDVVDALWWRAHPLVDAPSGAHDPARDRPRLLADVYSRGAEAEAQARAEARLLDLDRQLADDAAALDSAIEDARPELDAGQARAAERVAAAARAEHLGPAGALGAGGGSGAEPAAAAGAASGAGAGVRGDDP